MTSPIGIEFEYRPVLRLDGSQGFWGILHDVNTALKSAGLDDKAEEFRRLALEECDGDAGMLNTLAFLYIRYPGQEY